MSLTRQYRYSEIAQWWSNRLLTGRLWVRAPPLEPIFCLRRSGGIGRRPGLKILCPFRAYRFDPGLRHQTGKLATQLNRYRGVEQLVARRAHNPEAAGSSPVPATKKVPDATASVFFILEMRTYVRYNVNTER